MILTAILAGVLIAVEPAAGAPAAATDPTKPAGAPTAAEQATYATPDGPIKVELPPGTHSVVKRPSGDAAAGDSEVKAGYGDGGPLVPVAPPNKTIVDPAVKPATATAPIGATGTTGGANSAAAGSDNSADAATQATAQASSDLITQALTTPKDAAIPGRLFTLMEILARAGGERSRQMATTHSYWKLSMAQADYYWSVDELSRLDQITPAKGFETSLLATARAADQARMLEAKAAVIAAQQELADLIAIPSTSPAPLAADVPLVGPYRTYFDQLFANRVAPPRTRTIDRTLPVKREAIEARVAAVHSASTAAHVAIDARAKSQADLQALLNCETELNHQRRALLATVRDYNNDIADYALSVADINMPLDRLVAMMIVVKPQAPLGASSSNSTSTVAPGDAYLLQPAAPAPLSNPPVAARPLR
jgi:hypothetical protein